MTTAITDCYDALLELMAAEDERRVAVSQAEAALQTLVLAEDNRRRSTARVEALEAKHDRLRALAHSPEDAKHTEKAG